MGLFIVGGKMTIHDVAEALGVSSSTVSRALSGKGRIGEATRKRILSYVEECDYHPNGIAQSLAWSQTNNIAIIIPEVKELVELPFFYTCMQGVIEVAQAHEYDMFVVTTNGTDTSDLKRLIDNNKVDGMILGRTYKNDVFASYLKSKKIPFVTIGSLEDPEIVQVDHDHRGACKDLTSLLLSRKLQKIAYIGSDMRQIVNEERFAGYVQAHEMAGHEIDWSLVFCKSSTASARKRQVKTILDKNADCILCQDDGVCNQVLRELKELNVSVPEGIRVASCHNSKILDSNLVSITSLKFDAVEIGRTACRILLDMLQGIRVNGKTVLEYEVILKESTK